MSAEAHDYEPCAHPGRHGYTLPGDEQEYAFCERCRRPESAHQNARPTWLQRRSTADLTGQVTR